MEPDAQALFDHVGRILNRLVFLEKKAVFEFAGVRLHASEVHVLHALLREPDVGVGRLAAALDVTPGAVSQTLTRLAAKDMIRKHAERAEGNEVRIAFTESGRAAINRFLDERAALWQRHKAFLASLSESERRVVQGFLTSLDVVIDDLA